MTTELYKDNVPAYVYNYHTTYENTVLQEHANIVNGFKDTGVSEALVEAQARLFIGACLKNDTENFIKDRFEKYFKEEFGKIINITDKKEKEHTANVRVWIHLVNDAFDVFIKKYKVDGSRAKIAVLDNETMDGKPIVEAEQIVDFTTDNHGL